MCYVVPGLAESELNFGLLNADTLWPSPSALTLGQIGGLRLAANGIDPGPPDGIELTATGALLPYCTLPSVQLHGQLLRHGYFVSVHWYDWRKQMLAIGQDLAARIRREVTATDPCTLVGHSHGGIISRVAWRSLVLSGETNLVRRVISLGTAHAGSYAAVELLSTGGSMVDGILSWNQTVGDVAWGGLSWVGYRQWSRTQLITLASTWPAIYEVFPLLDGPDSGDDPNREDLYDANNWTGAVTPSQAWLLHSLGVIGPLMRSADTRPPGHIMTSVVGSHLATPARLDYPELLGRAGAIGSTDDGDGTVTTASGYLPGSKKITVSCAHIDLLPTLVGSGELAEWILEERSPSPDPPPPVVVPTVYVQQLQNIPGVVVTASPSLWSDCSTGRCDC